MSTDIRDSEWLATQLRGRLPGFTVFGITELDEDGFFQILLKNDDGEYLALVPSCDPEGNGPGFLFTEEIARRTS